MMKGNHEYKQYCVRAKISMSANNKCMRDPVAYRYNDTPHIRTGTQFKIYPTYDFACPAVDSWEGVTHACRSSEYLDRNELYNWFLKTCKLRPVIIFEFARLNLVNTIFSKRKLAWFVDNNKVEGWDDPRFPTLRGIMRRGCLMESLTEFMLQIGPSKSVVVMEWDKLWAINRQMIDPIAPRYTALAKEKLSLLCLDNVSDQMEAKSALCFNKNPELGEKLVYFSKNINIEFADANIILADEKITLMNWGNV